MLNYEKSLDAYHQHLTSDQAAEHVRRTAIRSPWFIGSTLLILVLLGASFATLILGANLAVSVVLCGATLVAARYGSRKAEKAITQMRNVHIQRNEAFLNAIKDYLNEQGIRTESIDLKNQTLSTDHGLVTIEPGDRPTDPNQPATYTLLLNGGTLTRSYQALMGVIEGKPLDKSYRDL